MWTIARTVGDGWHRRNVAETAGHCRSECWHHVLNSQVHLAVAEFSVVWRQDCEDLKKSALPFSDLWSGNEMT